MTKLMNIGGAEMDEIRADLKRNCDYTVAFAIFFMLPVIMMIAYRFADYHGWLPRYDAIRDFVKTSFTEQQRASMSLDDIVRASRAYLKRSPEAEFYNKLGRLISHNGEIKSNVDTQYIALLTKAGAKLAVPPHVRPTPVWRQENTDDGIRFIPYWELDADDDFNQGLIAAWRQITKDRFSICGDCRLYLVDEKQAISIKSRDESSSGDGK